MEVEAKYSIPDRVTFDRLRQLEEWVGYRLEPAGVKRVHDRYLDTDDRAIMRAGYACRVRLRGQDCIATLKGLGGAEAASGIHHRAEYEVSVDHDDPTAWPESRARDLALQLSGGRQLHELFTLNQERHLCLLYADGPQGPRRVAELSLDVVTPGQDGSQLYYELELELLDQGREADLQVLTGDLKEIWGLWPEPRSKFERGLDLADAV